MELCVHWVFSLLFSICLYFRTVNSCVNGNLLAGNDHKSEEFIRTVVRSHNLFRNYVAGGLEENQPLAENMREMQWDSKLAEVAQNYANRCVFEHNKNRNKQAGESVGENLYIRYSTDESYSNVSEAIKAWYDEVKLGYNGKFSYKTGHYSQVIWANSYKLGCGQSRFVTKGEFKYRQLVVCNYGPPGNYNNQTPYKKGVPSCEKHGLYQSERYLNLCTDKAPTGSNKEKEGSRNTSERQTLW